MKQRPRIYYTESQKALMWERWRNGESLQQLAPLFVIKNYSIQRILAETGGRTFASSHPEVRRSPQNPWRGIYQRAPGHSRRSGRAGALGR